MYFSQFKSYCNPLNYLKRGNYSQRKLSCLFLIIIRLHHFLLRFFLKPKISKNNIQIKALINDLNQNGYTLIKPFDTEFKKSVDQIIKQCETIKKNKNLKKNNKKEYLVPLLDDYEFVIKDNFFKFVTNNLFLIVSSNYLSSIPILTYLNLWFSPRQKDSNLKGSQLWHLDHESFRQLKIFLFVRDVDKKSGPTTLINKYNSLQKQKELNYNLKENNKHFELKMPKEQEISIEGKKGDVLLIDTSSCFHRGANNVEKERLVLMFQFLPIYAYSSNKFNNFKKYNFSNNSLIKKVFNN